MVDKPRIPERLPLIQGRADIADRLAIQFRVEQGPIVRQPVGLVLAQTGIHRMRCQLRVALAQAVLSITAPAVVRRIIDHPGAHRIEFDIALTQEQIGVGLHQG